MSVRGLLVYGYEPSGHSAAAFAIEEAGRKAGLPFFRVEIAGSHHPAAGLAVARAYHGLLRAAPAAYGALYRSPFARAVLRAVRTAYLAAAAGPLREGVRRSGADVVVAPQASVAAVLAEARRRGELPVPVVSVLTDFSAHPFWTDPPADFILAPSEGAAAGLRARGARAVASGIPVHPAFEAPPSRDEARAALALPASAPVVLLSGGGKGLGGLERLAAGLLAASPRARVLALCGADDRLRLALSRGGERLRAFGPQPPAFVAALMAAADVHVGKPGGLSAAESLASGLPMVLPSVLPGQEEGNAAHLLASGAALRGGAGEAAALLEDRPRLDAMRAAAAASALPSAAARAVEEIRAFAAVDSPYRAR